MRVSFAAPFGSPLLALAFASSFVASAAAQSNVPAQPDEPLPPETAALSLEDAVRLALEANLALTAEQFNRLTARESVIVAQAPYDPTLRLTSTRAQATEPQVNTLDASQSSTFRNALTVSQTVDTGATVSVRTNLDRSSNNRVQNRINPAYDSDVVFSVSQPLLRGGGLTTNRIPRQRARIGVTRSDLTYLARAMDIVRDTELAFFDVTFARRQLEVQRSGLAAAERFLQENEARRAAGLATELDVMQARVGVATRRSSIITAEQSVRDAMDRLLALLGRTEFASPLDTRGVSFAPAEPVSVEKSYLTALANDPDILGASEFIRQLELDVRLAHNQRLPTVNLGGTLGYTGTDSTLGASQDNLLERDAYNWQIDLSVTVPWALREGRSRLRTSKFNLEQQRVRLRQLEQDLLVRVRQAVRQVESDSQIVDINALSTELSSREAQLEKAKFDAGLSTSRLVVEAQQRQDEAQVRETQARVRAQQNQARLRRVEGASLDRYNLAVDETPTAPEALPPSPVP